MKNPKKTDRERNKVGLEAFVAGSLACLSDFETDGTHRVCSIKSSRRQAQPRGKMCWIFFAAHEIPIWAAFRKYNLIVDCVRPE